MDMLLITMVILSLAVHAGADCRGELLPHDPVTVVGGNLTLTCTVNPSTCPQALTTSSNFSFTLGDKNEVLPTSYWNRTSPTTAVLQLNNISILNNEHAVMCFFQGSTFSDLIAGQILAVDYPVAVPTDMECISYNTESMNCTWIFPYCYRTHVNIEVLYTTMLNYGNLKCPTSLNPEDKDVFKTHVERPPEGRGNATEILVSFDKTTYKKKDYCFQVTVHSNTGLTLMKGYSVSYRDIGIVKPNQVRNLSVKEGSDSSTSLTITMKAPIGLDAILLFKGGLLFMISYHTNWNQSDVKSESFVSTEAASQLLSHTLSNLIPHTKYSISVRCKVNKTESKYWSDPINTSHVTHSAAPELAPVLPPGAYFWLEGYKPRRLRIYWQKMKPEDEYGVPQGYSVIHNGLNTTIHDPNKLFQDFNVNEMNEFKVYLLNDVGHSIRPSTMIVPNIDALPPKPVNVGLKPNSKGDGTSAQLYWTKPKGVDWIEGYMIYLCEQDSVHTCKGSIQSFSIPAEQTSYTIDFSSLTYGIRQDQASVGIATVSWLPDETKAYSGIEWACAFPINGGDAAAPDVEKEVDYDSIKLSWTRLSCSESKSWVHYYQVEYWDVMYCNDSTCKHEKTIDYWEDKVNTTLTGLHPNTAYKVIVRAVTENGKSAFSNSTVTTKHVDISIKQVDNEDKVNISWAEFAINPEKIRANFTLEGKPKHQIYLISNTTGGHEVVNFKECSRLSIETVVNVDFYLLGHNDRVLSKKPSSPMRMCAPIPLSDAQISGIAIGSLAIGIVLIFLLFKICRFYQVEKRKTDQLTTIVILESTNGGVIPREDDDYFPNGRDSMSGSYDWKVNNNAKMKDSGRGPISSSSSTAPLISQVSMLDDVFDSEKEKRGRNDSGQSYSKLDMRKEADPNQMAGYMTRDQFERSDSYIDNEALSEPSDFDIIDKKQAPAVLTEEYSQFGMERPVIEPRNLKPGPGYINPDQIMLTTVDHSPVNIFPQRCNENYIDKDVMMQIGAVKSSPTLGRYNPSPLTAPPGGGGSDNGSGPGSNVGPPKDSSVPNSGYVVYGENGVMCYPGYASDYVQDGSVPNTRLSAPINRDSVGYVPHETFPVPTDSNEIDSGVDDGSGESLPAREKRDSGYLSPEYAGGSFSFINTRNNGSQNTDSARHSSTSSGESVSDARDISKPAHNSGKTVNAGYVTETQLKDLQLRSRET